MKRVLTGLLLAPLIAYVVLWGPYPLFLAVLALVGIFCFREYSNILSGYGIAAPGPLGYVAGLALLVLPGDATLFVVLLTLLALTLAMAATEFKAGMPRAAATVLGVLYVFGVWRCAALLRMESPWWLMFALALSWAGDIAAFYVGKTIGKHKMAPRVSPGKSWEGAAGSLAGSVLFGVVYLGQLMPEVNLWHGAAFAAAGNVAGQIGDLAESSLKRGGGVKDSGAMLPGHGGWLDRVDSSLFSVPVVYFLVKYFV